MNELDHAALGATVRQIVLLEKQSTALMLLVGALQRDGVPDLALAGCIEGQAAIRRDVNRWKRHIARDWRDTPVIAWARGVHGLGDAITLVLGIAPPLEAFATVSKLWKYAGFAPGQKAIRGQKHNFSPLLRAFLTVRIADPCIKQRACPYRRDYDARRALTAVTHPDWTAGHSHNDARRIVAKAVLRDMWLVAHGKQAKVEGRETAAAGSMIPISAMPPSSPKKSKVANFSLIPTSPVPPSSFDDGQGGHSILETHSNDAVPRRRRSPVLEPA